MKRVLSSLLSVVTICCFTFGGSAEAKYPTKPITAYCQFGPGGVADLTLRLLADYATKNGYPMNVINMPGGSGAQAGLEIVKSRADGYKIYFATTSLTTSSLRKNVGFDVTKSFIPVVGLNSMYLSFVVNTDTGIQSFEEWMKLALANPGQYNYASPGAVSSQRIFMENLIGKKFPGADIQNVPFTSGNETNTALLGNHVKASIGVPGTNKAYIESGDFKFLAVTSPERLAAFPDVPTFAELYGKEFEFGIFHVIYVNAKTPKNIINDLEGLFQRALADPEVSAAMKKMLFEPEFTPTEEATKKVKEQYDLIKGIMKSLSL